MPKINDKLFKHTTWELITFKDCEDHNNKSGNDRRKCPYYDEIKQCQGRKKTMLRTFKKFKDHNNKSVNDRRKCPYYDEIKQMYGYRPNVRPLYYCQFIIGRDQSSTSLHDHAPKNTNSSSIDDDEEDFLINDQTVPIAKVGKRKYVSAVETSTNIMMDWLKTCEAKKDKKEEERLKLLNKMHTEKMNILQQLLEVMKK